MKLAYLLYDVFTAEPLLGNQLAVFLDGSGVDTRLMQRIAREMHLSESTFVLPAETPDTLARVRIFTPTHEMPMAGHPTIGTTFALAHTGVIPAGTGRIVLGLNVGPTPVDLEWLGSSSDLRFAWMTQGRPVFDAEVTERAKVAAALGLDESALVPGLPVRRISCGVPYLIVPLRDRKTVDRAVLDAAALARVREFIGDAPNAVYIFASEPGAPEHVYTRMFAPGIGVAEDPATGSAAGPLGCYLIEHSVSKDALKDGVSGDALSRITITQGVAMRRESHIHVSIAGTPGAITQVKVGGQAVRVGRGELFL